MEQQQLSKKKTRLRPRFFSMVLIIMIMILSVYFVWYRNQNRLPNLHGWASTDVLAFAEDNNIEVVFEFVYSDTVAPTLVSNQGVQPGTMMYDDLFLMVEISKGVQVR